MSDAFLVHNPLTPCEAIQFDADLCISCDACVEVCRCDVLAPSPGPGQPPILVFPDECWFCGCCVAHCPVTGAIRMEHPLSQRVSWKRKDTGEHFRIGMESPPPSNTRPPAGGWGPPGGGR